MKRQRPQWQSACTILSLIILGIVALGSEAGEEGRKLQTVPPVLQPIPPPNEVNVTSSPTFEPSGTFEPTTISNCPPTEKGGGCGEPVAAPAQEPFFPSVAPIDFGETPGPFEVQTPQPVDQQTPQPVDPQTPQPVAPQTPQPVAPQTPQPVDPQTPQPVDPQTPQPVDPQTPQPVVPQTPQPVDPQTPQPVDEPQTPQPVDEPQTPQPVDEPQTPQPVDEPQTPQPVDEQTPQPVEEQTREPSLPVAESPVAERPVMAPSITPPVEPPAPAPTATTEAPVATSAPPVPRPTHFQLTDPPTSKVAEVPIAPFVLTLGFDEQQTGSAQDLQVLVSEVERILSETLFDALTAANTDDSVMLEFVDLTVTPDLGRRRADNNVFEDGQPGRGLRALQQETVDFFVSGTAVYAIAGNANVDEEQLTKETNQVVATTMQDPETQQALTEAFQANAESEALRNTTSVSATVQGPSVNGSDKPSTVAAVFGFILVGLAVVGLCMYGWAFYKKRRKRSLQRKRERERGLRDSYTNVANTTASMGSSINQSRSSPDSKLMVLPPTEFEESSESESASSYSEISSSVASESAMIDARAAAPESAPSDSGSSASDLYEGIDSETSSKSSKSDFTKELELAASLDRRSWIDTQRERSAVPDEDEGAIQYPSQYAVEGGEPQGASGGAGAAAGIAAAAAGVAAVAVASYPYGDEKDGDDDSDKNSDDEEVFRGEEEGIEWTAEGVWSPYDGYTKEEAQASEKSRESVSSLSDSRMTDSRSGRGTWLKSWSSIDSFRERRRRESKDPNAYMNSWSSIDSAREAKMRGTLLGSRDEDTESKEEEILVEATERGIEVETTDSTSRARMSPTTASSAGTSNAVRMSPTASAVMDVAASEGIEVQQPSPGDDEDADSVLTQDIVKEVSRLARFVKKYDKKREKKLLKEREREEKAALAIKDSQASPGESVGYDAMSDSISALRKGPVETSPRQERTALANQVEESDESGDESERSWSTTSNANRAFDDEEESSQVIEESEIDVSDDSSAEEEMSVTASDTSRLGINPFSVQRVVGVPQTANNAKRSKRENTSPPETARPPVSGKQSKKKALPPLPSTPGSPDEEDSPEKTSTPIQTVKRAMRRVSSARQQKFSQKSMEEQPLSKQSRDVDLTEDVLRELSGGQEKGALAGLRKNEAILDTASSHFTDGVTPSQYEQAFKAGIIAQQEQQRALLERRSFKQMMTRVPRDPPASTAESASLHASDEKRSPPGWEAKDTYEMEEEEELRAPPAEALPKAQKRGSFGASQERVPWSQSAAPPQEEDVRAPPTEASPKAQKRASFGASQPWSQSSAPSQEEQVPRSQPAAPQALPEQAPWARSAVPLTSQKEQSIPSHQTERKAPSFKAPSFKPGVQPATSTPLKRTINRNRPPSPSLSAHSQQSGSKRAAPEAAPPTQQETARAPAPAVSSPPRRKNKRGSALNNVISMFEQKPHNAIYPAGANWQFNGATR